jgi:DNA repair exonuclease SbcCD ATPase subunit
MFAFGLGAKVAAGMGVLMLAMGAGFYFYFNYTQERIEDLNSKVTQFEEANKALERTLQRREEELIRQARGLGELNREISQIRREANELTELLARHDLKRLASARPGLIERRVNDGTKEVFDQLREITDPDRYQKPGESNER